MKHPHCPQKQSSTSTIEHEISSAISSNKLRHTNIPLPSWGLSSTDYRKRFPTQCPHLSTHLTLECLVWIMVIVCLLMGGGNTGSVIVLVIFYLIIQGLLYCIGYCYVHGLHRYKSIISVPLYDEKQWISWFHNKFDKSPLISLNLMMYESMISMNPIIIDQDVNVSECATMIALDDQFETEWNSWFYCVEYETEIDFISDEMRERFKNLCIEFASEGIENDKDDQHEIVSFECKVVQDMIEEYNQKYWNGYVMIINCEWKFSLYLLRFVTQILNILCLSLLYKIPLYFVSRKRLKIIKYLGFES